MKRSVFLAVLALFFCISATNGRTEEAKKSLTKTADDFFRTFLTSDKDALLEFEPTEPIKTWIRRGGSEKAAKGFLRLCGEPKECLKTEIVNHERRPVVFLYYTADKKSFRISVAFEEGKVAGIHYVPWTPETDHLGAPVVLETPTGKIYGSLLLPDKKQFGERVPVVLFIAGSGPTDRNGNQPSGMMCNAFSMLAEALQKNGIASLRFDKRGIAASAAAGPKEEDLRFEHLVDDVSLWIDFLDRRKKYSSIIVLGHSEGSLVGMLACEKNDANNGKVDAFISVCGAGRTIDRLLFEQYGRQSKFLAEKLSPLLDELKKGNRIDDVPQEFFSLLRPSVQPYMISWLKHDPAAILRNMTVSTLVIQGTTDIQVTTEDAELLSQANPMAKTVIIEEMNHVLKNCKSTAQWVQMLTYANPTLPIDEELVQVILDFISELKSSR